MASKLDFADLRDSPSALIGAFTNRWTMELVSSLRYRFAMPDSQPRIVDSSTGKEWTPTDKPENGRSTQDYILICRLPRAKTGGFMVVGAGLTQYGTHEVGRILADPNALAPVLSKRPPDWPRKNVQLLLHSEVVGDEPS